MRIGCCGNTENYVQISKTGFDYIELSGRQLMALSEYQREDFLRLYEKTGFPCIAINDYCGSDTAIVGPNFSPSVIRRYASVLMEYAHRLGVRNVGIGAPAARKLPEGYPSKAAMFEMMTFLYITCEEAARYGINVLLEAVHSGLTDYMNHTQEAADMVKALRGIQADSLDPEMTKLAQTAVAGRKIPDNLWMVYDYYNAMAMDEDLTQMAAVMPLVKHLHYSTDLGNNDRGYPHAENVRELADFLKAAADAGYAGDVSVEANYSRYLNYDGDLCVRIMRMAVPGEK